MVTPRKGVKRREWEAESTEQVVESKDGILEHQYGTQDQLKMHGKGMNVAEMNIEKRKIGQTQRGEKFQLVPVYSNCKIFKS